MSDSDSSSTDEYPLFSAVKKFNKVHETESRKHVDEISRMRRMLLVQDTDTLEPVKKSRSVDLKTNPTENNLTTSKSNVSVTSSKKSKSKAKKSSSEPTILRRSPRKKKTVKYFPQRQNRTVRRKSVSTSNKV